MIRKLFLNVLMASSLAVGGASAFAFGGCPCTSCECPSCDCANGNHCDHCDN